MGDEKTWKMFIGGECMDSSSGETEPDINPATGESVATVQVGTRHDADKAVAAARKAYEEVWFDTPPKERSAMMLKLADALDDDADNLTRPEAEDVGKPISVSAADIPFITPGHREDGRGDREGAGAADRQGPGRGAPHQVLDGGRDQDQHPVPDRQRPAHHGLDRDPAEGGGDPQPLPQPDPCRGLHRQPADQDPGFPSHWELSAARAANVVHLFSRAGLDPARMAAIGYGEHQPVADNRIPEGRNGNRRVVLVVLADPNARRMQDLMRDPPRAPDAETPAGAGSETAPAVGA